jgi:predicted Zn-ribbon and HTH transcriptional regulator
MSKKHPPNYKHTLKGLDELQRIAAGDAQEVKHEEPRETQFVDTVIEKLKAIGGDWEKRHGSGRGLNGQPDITGCIEGRRVEIEAKVGGNNPSELQLQRLVGWAKAGAACAVAWNGKAPVKGQLAVTMTNADEDVDILILEGYDEIEAFLYEVQAQAQARKYRSDAFDATAYTAAVRNEAELKLKEPCPPECPYCEYQFYVSRPERCPRCHKELVWPKTAAQIAQESAPAILAQKASQEPRKGLQPLIKRISGGLMYGDNDDAYEAKCPICENQFFTSVSECPRCHQNIVWPEDLWRAAE